MPSKLPDAMQKEIREFCQWALELTISDAGQVIELMQAVRTAHVADNGFKTEGDDNGTPH